MSFRLLHTARCRARFIGRALALCLLLQAATAGGAVACPHAPSAPPSAGMPECPLHEPAAPDRGSGGLPAAHCAGCLIGPLIAGTLLPQVTFSTIVAAPEHRARAPAPAPARSRLERPPKGRIFA